MKMEKIGETVTGTSKLVTEELIPVENVSVENESEEETNNSGWFYLINIALILLFWTIFTFVVSFPMVHGISMEPTYHDGNLLILDKFHCQSPEDINRGDVVVAWSDQLGVLLIKRVVGLPGETVQVIEGQVYIDGVLLSEDFPLIEDAGAAADPCILGENEFFLMGDNRNHSEDSRVIGGVAFEDIQGVVTKVLWD